MAKTLTPFMEKVLTEWFARAEGRDQNPPRRQLAVSQKQCAMVEGFTAQTDVLVREPGYITRSTEPVIIGEGDERWYFEMHRWPNKAGLVNFVDYGTAGARSAAAEEEQAAKIEAAKAKLAEAGLEW